MRNTQKTSTAASLIVALALTGCSSDSRPDTSARVKPKPSASASATTVSPPEPVKGKPVTITIGASGDLIAHPNTVRKASAAAGGNGYAFSQFMEPMRSTVTSPAISICQMENPVSADDTDLSRELSFYAPHEFATATHALGFDGCSTANNHTWDRKLHGVMTTRRVLAQNGLKAAGPGESASAAGQPQYYEANGLKVAHLSYSYTLNNLIGDNITVPEQAPWLSKNMWAVRKAQGIEQDAAAARAQGADLVLVSLHWGDEYQPVNAAQKDLAHALLTSGQVDWIIGNHPHIVQPCEKINGRYVNYALGNFFSGQVASYLPGTADGAFASVTFRRNAEGTWSQSMAFQPTYQDQMSRVIQPAGPTQHPESYNKTVATMRFFGCDAKPTP